VLHGSGAAEVTRLFQECESRTAPTGNPYAALHTADSAHPWCSQSPLCGGSAQRSPCSPRASPQERCPQESLDFSLTGSAPPTIGAQSWMKPLTPSRIQTLRPDPLPWRSAPLEEVRPDRHSYQATPHENGQNEIDVDFALPWRLKDMSREQLVSLQALVMEALGNQGSREVEHVKMMHFNDRVTDIQCENFLLDFSH